MNARAGSCETARSTEPSTLFDLLPIGAYRCSAEGRLVRANAALVRLAGFASEAELLATVGTATGAWYVEPGRYAELLARVEAEGEVHGFVSEVRRDSDGRRIWISENAHALRGPDGRIEFFEGTVEEITERVAAAQALERSERQLRELAERVPGLVFRLHLLPEGRRRFSFVSEGVRTLYGFAPEDVYADGDLLRRHDHPEDHARVVAEFAASAATGEPVSTVMRIVDVHGEVKWVHLAASPPMPGEPVRTRVGVMIDVTSRIEADHLRQQRDRAAAAERAQAEFLSRVSHELRTPLNAVLGFAQLLQAERLGSERQQAWIETIIGSGNHLLSLVNDLLDLSAAQTGRLPMSLATVDAGATAREAWAAHAMAAAAAGVHFEDRLPPAPGPFVRADRMRLRQVLDNLLSNAIKYHHRGGCIWVASAAGETAGTVALQVGDDGPGIGPEQAARLFRPFERLGAEHGGVAGTGLGLALSRQLVEAMGGTIAVQGAPGVGSTFTVTLPAAAAV